MLKKLSMIAVLGLFGVTIISAQATAQTTMMEQETTTVNLETNQGTIKIKLYPAIAPKTCENFVGLIKKGYYDGLIFHRVIPGFMIQGGDPTGTGMGGESLWGGKFDDEFSPQATFSKPGMLAMANAGPGTNGSQFFITVAPTKWLNNHHTIFGEVIEGMDIVEKIVNAPRGANDKPTEPQRIIKATTN